MVKPLDRKLLRDLGALRGQIITICLVVAAGIAGFVAMQTAYRSLTSSKTSYYETYRFADVFASARRAPDATAARIRQISGVSVAYTRTVGGVRIPLEGGDKAADGQIVSLPDHGEPPLNAVHLTEGRMPDLARSNEALLLEQFAEVNKVKVGDFLPVIMEGVVRQIKVTGLAMSPEYVMASGGDVIAFKPGSFAVLWMRRAAMSPAFDMNGAFNDIVLRLQPGAAEPAVLDDVDRILAPYGGLGAYGRDKQPSDHFVTSELDGLKVTVTIIPLIFLGVAAFLVNVVLGRLVDLQRGQIATLKALGYGNWSIGSHYLKLVSVIVAGGSLVGVGAGAMMGGALLGVYEAYFRFPDLQASFDPSIIVIAVSISLVAAFVGALMSVHRIVVMPPAEAMRPPSPPTFKTNAFDRFSSLFVGPLGQMVLRGLRRSPARFVISVVGISMAVSIMLIGQFASDSMDSLLEIQFEKVMREDLTVGLREAAPQRVMRSMRALEGVSYAEGLRSVPVRLRAGTAVRDTVIQGFPDDVRLRQILNRDGVAVSLPLDGVVLTDVLAERLGVKPGEFIEFELLEGDRRTGQVRVAGTVEDLLGMQGYMRMPALDQLLGQGPSVSMVLLNVDAEHLGEVKRRLYAMPAVASVASPGTGMSNFRETQGGTMLAMSFVLAFFAVIIAVGIIYNNARVTLSMRQRDLASMRVLGFTRAEVSTVLLGELAAQVLLALPLGMWLGTMASGALVGADPENFRLPVTITMATYTTSALITMAAAAISGFLVRRKLDHLDLIGVLKSRE